MQSKSKKSLSISCDLRGTVRSKVSGTILTSDTMDAHNTFSEPNRIHPTAFNGAAISNNTLSMVIPPKSVILLEV